MGNQLAAATAVNVADVSSSLELVAPLGGENRNYFRSFHCVKVLRTDSAMEPPRSTHLFAGGDRREKAAQPRRSQLHWAGSTEVVVKVFVRTLGGNTERRLVEFCYDHLLSIGERMACTRRVNHGSNAHNVSTVRCERMNNSGGDTGVLPCNVLFYSGMEVHNDRFCMLERPYVAFSLVERLATRPYWNAEKRLFAGYQLLQSLVQLHETWETVHGDLKVDNVLVDTAGWLYVTDICPFKPALLPANNPALFDHYYDTSETRICFLAPEKFVEQPLQQSISNINAKSHTQAMDVFSAACVLAHIFTEEPLFRLSDVLELRCMKTREDREAVVGKTLTERGVSPNICRMLLTMLCTSVENRPSARQLLEDFTPVVFPSYFSFLFFDIFPSLLARPPDLQVQLLWSRLDDILDEAQRRFHTDDSTLYSSLHVADGAKQTSVLLLLPILVNASLHLVTADASCRLISLFQRILPYCPTEVQADTILPYILHYVKVESYPVVSRMLALRTLSTICHSISFSASEATMFDDLILPCMEDLVLKTATSQPILLVEIADQLPGILLLARKFLESCHALASANAWQKTFGKQLNDLLDRGWDLLRLLYKSSHIAVVVGALRRTTDVVAFLGEERAQDDLIPFLTTIASAIDVQRELYPQAILCHLNLQTPRLKTLRFFVDEGLRRVDATCLMRTIDSISAIVERKCLAAWDLMSLVHQALPHVMNPNRWVSTAACRLVEKVACTYRVSDVWVYLECAMRPLLRRQVPLVHIASFPAAVKLELSEYLQSVEELSGCVDGGTRILCGDVDSRERILCSIGAGREPRYTVPHKGIANHFLYALVSRSGAVDISFDTSMLEPVEHELDVSAADHCGGVWKLFFKPTPREKKRLALRQHMESEPSIGVTKAVANTNTSFTPVVEEKASFRGFYATGCRHQNTDVANKTTPHHPMEGHVVWGENELKPIAAPWFTQMAHLGGIYCSCATGDCTLVTAGGRGEATLWSLGAEGMDYSHRIQSGASTMSTFLFSNFLREGSSPLLYMGGTDGEWRVCDVASNSVLTRRVIDGSTLTAACPLGGSTALVSTAMGGVFAMDERIGKDVWHAKLDPSLGSPSGLSPLFHESRAYGVSVTTFAGVVALFDVRFQMLLKFYRLDNGGMRSSCFVDNPNAITCVSPGFSSTSPVYESPPPGILLLGTQGGSVHHLDLATGNSWIALQPATSGRATRALLVQPRHSVVLTAGDDMWIRKWCTSSPLRSTTLVYPPYKSPAYMQTTNGSIAESQSKQHSGAQSLANKEMHSTEANAVRHKFIPQHHDDSILTLCAVSNDNETYLASGSRDGTLTVWFNAE